MSSYGKNPKSQFLRTSSINSISETSENTTEKVRKSLKVNDLEYFITTEESVGYSELLKLESIQGTEIEERFSEENDYDLNERMSAAIYSCEKVKDNQGYVRLNSRPFIIRITKDGVRHGLIGKVLSGKQKRITGKSYVRKSTNYNNANICDSLGDIIKNSVVVNELADRTGGLVLMGYAYSGANQYIVRTLAKKVGNEYLVEAWDSTLNLYSVNTKNRDVPGRKNLPYRAGTKFHPEHLYSQYRGLLAKCQQYLTRIC